MTATPADGTTLADRLQALFPAASGRSRKTWLARGRVTVNDCVVRDGRTPVRPGDRVALGAETIPAVTLQPPLRLVHEDEHLLVIEKPPNLLTVATASGRRRTAYRLVWTYLAAARPARRPFVVHRLDRATSGLLLLAKSPAAKRRLQEQFATHTPERRYVAIVEGRVAADAGTLEGRLVQDRSLRVRLAVDDKGGGRIAVTRYRVRERRGAVTVLDLALETGRRRQIRVQLAALGHPIVGDRTHGAATDPLRRLCLHATVLGFVHPVTGEAMRLESAAPAAFGRVGRWS